MPEVLTTTHLTVTPLAGHIGAEIGDADTGAPLADDVVAQIRQALLDHKWCSCAVRAWTTAARSRSPNGSAR